MTDISTPDKHLTSFRLADFDLPDEVRWGVGEAGFVFATPDARFSLAVGGYVALLAEAIYATMERAVLPGEVDKAVWDAADWPTRDAMDLAYLTGQRPADVLKMRLPDIRDGFLWLTQGKTRKKLRMAIAGELAALGLMRRPAPAGLLGPGGAANSESRLTPSVGSGANTAPSRSTWKRKRLRVSARTDQFRCWHCA